MATNRFELHTHSHYSNLRLPDAINTPQKLVDRAYEIGLAGIALTDHEALGGHVELDKLKTKYAEIDPNFKIAHGNEIYLVENRENGQKYWHFILIAKDKIGFKALKELSSIAWSNSYFDRGMERVPLLKEELKKVMERYGKGHIIGSSACLGSEVDHCIVMMETAKTIEEKKEWNQKLIDHINFCIDVFGKEDFYLEVQPAKSKEQIIVNNRMPAVANYFGLKVVVSTDAHYLTREERTVHKAFLNSKDGDREVDDFYETTWLQTTEEVIEHLEGTAIDYEEVAKNTLEIYNKIENFSLANKQQVPQVEVKDYPKVKGNTGYQILDSLLESDEPQERYWVNQCLDKMRELDIYNEIYLSRLEEEADIKKHIGNQLDTCVFAYPIFLQHYINMFWEVGSTVGAGRGSACSGLNHYLLGVTQLDPIKYELPFWRYMNKDRAELPDIDIDICPSKREEIFSRIREDRGELGCVQVCTYGTETSRSAIATACRGYRSKEFPNGIDNDIAQYMTSLAPQERGFIWPIKDIVYGNKEKDRKPVRTFVDEVNKYPGLLDIIMSIEGLISHRGIHASGVVFYDDDPYETSAFMKAKSGAITTQFSLHDEEYVGSVKYDFLVTEVQDIITQCLTMLMENEELPPWLDLRGAYDEFLHPEKLPIEDDKLWDSLIAGNVLKLFQFDSQVGGQTVKTLKPRTPKEMATCNSIMRLMAQEKGGETPTERYKRMKENIQLWYDEMGRYHLTKKEQEVLEKYCLDSYGTPAQQEDMMKILMDKDICGFSLKEANDARKICAKKQMDRIPELHKKILDKATSKNLGEYVWKVIVNIQLGYSFSEIHALAYSFIGLQTVYLATYFNPVYWNTACLRIDSGLEESDSSNYGKIAKAVGNIIDRGIKMSLIDINKSQYMFEPDIENETIIYGMKGLSGVNGETIQNIIENRPYEGLEDFMGKTKCNKTVMISLIKSGAFDQFGDRVQIMKQYIELISEPKKRITMQNFNGLNERGLIPDELDLQRRTFVFNKALKYVLTDGMYVIKDNFYDFYEQYFDTDLLEPYGNTLAIPKDVWKKKCYDPMMAPAKEYITAHKHELLEKLNNCLFQEVWDKYAEGSVSKWEMDSLGFYYHPHELTQVALYKENVREFRYLPEEPPIEREFEKDGRTIPIYETCRIAGTVIAKDDNKKLVSILTLGSGVVNVKFGRDYYAKYNRRISEIMPDGTKKVREAGWFSKGTLIVVNGIRRGDMFVAKRYKNTPSHQLYKITDIDKDGIITMTNDRWGD